MLNNKDPRYQKLSNQEWLVTNGIGGFSSGTVSGANTRRYHGLLIASSNPPVGRKVLVSKVEESVVARRDCCVPISTNEYPNVLHPQGYQYIRHFNASPLPETIFEVGVSKISKTVFMVQGSNTTVVEYENVGDSFFQLKLTPTFVNRDYHNLFRENPKNDFYFLEKNGYIKINAHFGAAPLYFKFTKGQFIENRMWFKNLQYCKEQCRGLDFQEDSYAIGQVECSLNPGEKCYLVFTLEEDMLLENPNYLKVREINYRNRLRPLRGDDWFKDLAVAAEQFIVKRKSTNGYTIIAGYPWFADWGRHAMISMRGLCIALGKKQVSESVFETFLSYLKNGMLPNYFSENGDGKVKYNTIDATLWLFVALYEYYLKFKDIDFIKKHFSKLEDIIQVHLEGTRYGIKVTKEGFLYGGDAQHQLTWMDAKVEGEVITSRYGCPVEINALWYNALKIFASFSMLLGESSLLLNRCEELILKLEENFSKYFLNDKGYLNDVVDPGKETDNSIRPNQIFALSLPFGLLSEKAQASVLEIVEKELYTPYGLRTLNKSHPEFKGTYTGNQLERDKSYHQGTVWPYLIGEYWRAYLKVNGNSPEVSKSIKTGLHALKQHFYSDNCIHGISEIFDGLTPVSGKGAFHQAWSVGALISVYEAAGLLDRETKKIPEFQLV